MKRLTLGNSVYSDAHPSIFDAARKKQLARQALSVIRNALPKKNLRTLSCVDIACGAGTMTFALARHFKRITGIDYDSKAIASAQKEYKRTNLSFKHQDATKTQLKNNSFDLAICQEVYSYVTNPEKLMSEIYRILKPGGICYFAADNLLFPIESQYKIPFLLYFPDPLARAILKAAGHKTYYLGHYKTYWGLCRLCRNFLIRDFTLPILNKPMKYQFVRLVKFNKWLDRLPDWTLALLKFFVPSYIWILQKPYGTISRSA